MLLSEKEIKEIKYVDVLESEYNAFKEHFSFKPDRNEHPYPKIGDVLDEEKSVRWNREEVARLRKEYEDCVAQLNKDFHVIEGYYSKHMISLLAKKYKITVAESAKIWEFAYEQCKAFGVYAIVGRYYDFADLYVELIKLKKA